MCRLLLLEMLLLRTLLRQLHVLFGEPLQLRLQQLKLLLLLLLRVRVGRLALLLLESVDLGFQHLNIHLFAMSIGLQFVATTFLIVQLLGQFSNIFRRVIFHVYNQKTNWCGLLECITRDRTVLILFSGLIHG